MLADVGLRPSEILAAPLAEPAVGVPSKRRHRSPKWRISGFITRTIDIVVAGVGLVVLAPILLVCVVLVRATSQGRAIYRQPRVGIAGHHFTILKLRTMYVDADDRAHREQAALELSGEGKLDGPTSYKDAHDPRVTPVGRWLRRLSLDEIPQLVNVLTGDMALVGPRPSLPYEVIMFPAWSTPRFWLRPGLTGLWQVSGRNQLSLVEMLGLDCAYVRNRSILHDLSIMMRTPLALFTGSA
jgi:lipopolysaccharide/colanic/teichoic acid biosynthesis glycosyltransferase